MNRPSSPLEEVPRSGDEAYAARLLESRRHMVATQIQARGIDDRRILEALLAVPREQFVPDAGRAESHSDWALPIGLGQTISQPYTVAFMADALQLVGSERVLEIGTGSGYGAAVLSRLAREVHSVERLPELADRARRRLANLDYRNVHVHLGDGSLGWPAYAPYDAICITAAAERLPQAIADQLADGGRIVVPLGGLQGGQRLTRFTRRGDDWSREDLGGFAFVPLIGEQGWKPERT